MKDKYSNISIGREDGLRVDLTVAVTEYDRYGLNINSFSFNLVDYEKSSCALNSHHMPKKKKCIDFNGVVLTGGVKDRSIDMYH